MKFQFRGFLSLLLAASFVILGVSGVILYAAPRGRVANWTGWTALGLDKREWQSLHIHLALLVLIASVLHLIWNWPIFWRYIKKQGSFALNLKMELFLALLLAIGAAVGAVRGFAPFDVLMTWNDRIKDYWDRWAASAPSPHAEELALGQYAANLGLTADDVLEALREAGIAVADPGATVGQVAEANGLTPAEVHAAVAQRFPEAMPARQGPGKGPGEGRRKGPAMGGGAGRGPGQGLGPGGGPGKSRRGGRGVEND